MARIHVTQGDIPTFAVDVIVNAGSGITDVHFVLFDPRGYEIFAAAAAAPPG